jgi:hypothetical protein
MKRLFLLEVESGSQRIPSPQMFAHFLSLRLDFSRLSHNIYQISKLSMFSQLPPI